MKRQLHDLVCEIRLAIAEMLILWSVRVSPRGHPDSRAIAEAALHVSRRDIT